MFGVPWFALDWSAGGCRVSSLRRGQVFYSLCEGGRARGYNNAQSVPHEREAQRESIRLTISRAQRTSHPERLTPRASLLNPPLSFVRRGRDGEREARSLIPPHRRPAPTDILPRQTLRASVRIIPPAARVAVIHRRGVFRLAAAAVRPCRVGTCIGGRRVALGRIDVVVVPRCGGVVCLRWGWGRVGSAEEG